MITHEELSIQLRSSIETECDSRLEEIRKFENYFFQDEKPIIYGFDFDGVLRKILIIVLYAHFEGFCRAALLLYVEYVNSLCLEVSQVKAGLAAIGLHSEFTRLVNPNIRPFGDTDMEKREKGYLQDHARRKEFFVHYRDYMDKTLIIPDKVVNMESNLRPNVLQKILFSLEIDCTLVDEYKYEINELVNVRNSYAHGDQQRPPTSIEYRTYKKKVEELMKNISDTVQDCFSSQKYLNEKICP